MFFFFFNDPATTEIYPLPLHDALPISRVGFDRRDPLPRGAAASGRHRGLERGKTRHTGYTRHRRPRACAAPASARSEEHTSELQSRSDLVCRLLLEKKKNIPHMTHMDT